MDSERRNEDAEEDVPSLTEERRDQIADQRDQVADQRDQVADQREQVADEREQAGDERDLAADERDEAGEQRDLAADERDRAADQRDRSADDRDAAGDKRDQAGDQRDEAAEQRDRAAEQTEAQVGEGIAADVLGRSALARREAASDRMRASQDRLAGAAERNQAELDRSSAMSDRGAAARERESSSIDELTGVYLRRAGFVELEREMTRVRRAGEPLVLAFIDVNGLKAINDSRGHAAGDQLLLEVAGVLRARLRSHDVIIRYGGDEFVCAISGLDLGGAEKRLALVNEALAETTEQGSVTVGLSELQAGDSPEELVARADAALYRQRLEQRSNNSSA
jgi:diguanylate cyclase (GGDEF)-like protein